MLIPIGEFVQDVEQAKVRFKSLYEGTSDEEYGGEFRDWFEKKYGNRFIFPNYQYKPGDGGDGDQINLEAPTSAGGYLISVVFWGDLSRNGSLYTTTTLTRWKEFEDKCGITANLPDVQGRLWTDILLKVGTTPRYYNNNLCVSLPFIVKAKRLVATRIAGRWSGKTTYGIEKNNNGFWGLCNHYFWWKGGGDHIDNTYLSGIRVIGYVPDILREWDSYVLTLQPQIPPSQTDTSQTQTTTQTTIIPKQANIGLIGAGILALLGISMLFNKKK